MNRLQFFRTIKGYSQDFVAQQVGIDQTTYSKFERGFLRLKISEKEQKVRELLNLDDEQGGEP